MDEEARVMTPPVTIDFDEKSLAVLDSFTMKLSRSELNKLAIDEWLTAQMWNVEEIESGIAEADRGEFASDEEVAKHSFRR